MDAGEFADELPDGFLVQAALAQRFEHPFDGNDVGALLVVGESIDREIVCQGNDHGGVQEAEHPPLYVEQNHGADDNHQEEQRPDPVEKARTENKLADFAEEIGPAGDSFDGDVKCQREDRHRDDSSGKLEAPR